MQWIARFADLSPPFRRLMASDALMLLALMIGHVCMPWWISQQGGARDLTLYSVANAAMSLAAMPLLSPLGDRHTKRQLVAWAMLAFALSAAGMALFAGSGRYHIGPVIGVQAVAVCAAALLLPATHSMVVELVPAAQVTRALGLQQSAQSAGRLVGPAIGGTALAALGTTSTLWLYCALLVGAAAVASRLPSSPAPRARRGAWWAELREGLRANWSVPIERGWILVNFLSWIFVFPALTMLVPLKVQSLGLSAVWLGLCEAALSLGMLLGSLGLAEWVIRLGGATPPASPRRCCRGWRWGWRASRSIAACWSPPSPWWA
jgi:MFS family permease